MLSIVKQEAMKPTNQLALGILFLVFLGLYIFLDFEGSTNYKVMTDNFGLPITLTHIGIDIAIASLTAVMVLFSTLNYKLHRVEPAGSNAIPFLSFIFGVLTFGCTGCVVAFLGAVGIAFTPLILPNANLLWKILALVLVIIGFIWIMYSIEKTTCKVKE